MEDNYEENLLNIAATKFMWESGFEDAIGGVRSLGNKWKICLGATDGRLVRKFYYLGECVAFCELREHFDDCAELLNFITRKAIELLDTGWRPKKKMVEVWDY